MKRNKGITLIALVITIIVLLILAGVAISMLSGENGILKKAAEAKTKTEQAKQDEETTLIDYEIDGYFIEKGYKYKCRYGYITGIDKGETAEKLSNILGIQGYKLRNIENTADVTNETPLTTGMAITKNGEIVARTIIFGDVRCLGSIGVADTTSISNYLYDGITFKEYQINAMDANHDGYIDGSDHDEIMDWLNGRKEENQYCYVKKLKTPNKIPTYDVIKKLNICDPSSIKEVKEGNSKYNTIVLNQEYTYQELTTKIKEVYPEVYVYFYDSEEKEIKSTSTDKIQNDVFLDLDFLAKVEDGSMPEELTITIQFK